MAMYDPATGKWYTYTPETIGEGIDGVYTPPSLVPAEAPGDAPANMSNWVDPTNNDPNVTAAQLLRSQFNEWQSSFKPIELNAINQISYNNPKILPEAVAKASNAATEQADTMRGVLSRSNAAMGIVPTEQQSQVSNRILSLDRSTAVAGAENRARGNVRTQDEQLLLGTSPNPNIVKGTIQ